MTNLFKRFVKDESGATAIEYGLIAAIVAVGIIAALGALEDNLTRTFDRVGESLVAAPAQDGGEQQQQQQN